MIIPRYSHNYAQFCQLLNSNLFTHRRILMLLRESTSETYGPRVYSHHINLITLILLCFLLCVGGDGGPPASTYGDGAPLFVRRGRRVHREQIVASTRAVYPGSGRGGRVKPYSCFGLYCFGELGSFKS